MKKYILILIALLGVNCVYAQISLISNNQKLVKDAVKNGIFLVRNSFQICDEKSGELFGLNGKDEFGATYSIGIKVADGMVMTKKAVRPWDYSTKFKKYEGKFKPVFYKSTYSSLGAKASYEPLDYNPDQQQALVDNELFKASCNTFKGDGFVLDTKIGDKKGWIIWIMESDDMDYKSSADLSFFMIRKDLSFKQNRRSFEILPPNSVNHLLGGLYVVPYFESVGKIEFRLMGLILQNEKNRKWMIYSPFIGMKEEPVLTNDDEVVEEKETDGANELTPISTKKGKKRRK